MRPRVIPGLRQVLWAAGVNLVVAASIVAGPGGARAADSIYWVNSGSNTIGFFALDGSEGGLLNTGGAPVADPNGLALDSASQQIYWANAQAGRLAYTSLFGLGGEGMETGEQPAQNPSGLAIDPAGERIYWAGSSPDGLFFATLDGSFGAPVEGLGGAAVSQPGGVVVDPATRRLYWTNVAGFSPISYANLDGSGAGNLDVGGIGASAAGLAIDHATGRVYWADEFGDKILFANLDGSGGGVVDTGAAKVSQPVGIAIDPAAGRIYWANRLGGKISFANLDGSGAGDLPTGSVPVSRPKFPILALAPRATAPPRIAGKPSLGSTLACSQGGWAPDAIESFLYQAPQTFAYQWIRDGAEVPGATASTIATNASGVYVCRVTARNHAGQTVQSSPSLRVTPVAFGKRTRVSLALASGRVSGAGRVPVRIHNANPFPITGALSPGASAFKVRAGATVRAESVLPRALRVRLTQAGSVTLTLRAEVTDGAGDRRVVEKRVTVR